VATVDTAANFLRLWCTDAPVGSVYRKQIDKAQAARVEITPPDAPAAGGISPGVSFNAQLEVGGRYTFVGQEYTLGATTYGGGYSNAPDAYKSETKIGGEQTLHIYVGQRMTHRLGASAYGTASLLVYAWNDTIRATSQEVHGVNSPAVINASTPRAVSAAASSGVQTQLALFKDAAVSTLAPNLATLIAEMVADLPKHFANTGGNFHANIMGVPTPDSDNTTEIADLSDRCGTPVGLVRAASVLYSRLQQHQHNGNNGSSRYHLDADFTNAMICDGAGGEADTSVAFAAIADIYRVYEAHRADATSHALADAVNTLGTALGPLLSLHKEFLGAMATLSPTTAGGTQSAVTTLTAYGFRLES
jgi:hypothetical protein